MRVTLRFDTEALFNEPCAAILDRYFAGELTAGQACAQLGWAIDFWNSRIAGIISAARHGIGDATLTCGAAISPASASLVGHLN
jgi:hypothetical protein